MMAENEGYLTRRQLLQKYVPPLLAGVFAPSILAACGPRPTSSETPTGIDDISSQTRIDQQPPMIPIVGIQPTATPDQHAYSLAFQRFSRTLDSVQGELNIKNNGFLESGRNYISIQVLGGGLKNITPQELVLGYVPADQQYLRVRWMTEDYALLTCAGSPCKNENWGSSMGESELTYFRFSVSKPSNPTPADVRNGLIWKVKISFSTRFMGIGKPLPISEANYPATLEGRDPFSPWENEDQEFSILKKDEQLELKLSNDTVLPLSIIRRLRNLAQKFRNTSGDRFFNLAFLS